MEEMEARPATGWVDKDKIVTDVWDLCVRRK
jgi:hypothetical protein